MTPICRVAHTVHLYVASQFRSMRPAVFDMQRRHMSAFQDEIEAHTAQRKSEGVVPLPLDAQQTGALVELLKAPPAGEEEFLIDQLENRVPPGVDDAAFVKVSISPRPDERDAYATWPTVLFDPPPAWIHALGLENAVPCASCPHPRTVARRPSSPQSLRAKRPRPS